MALPTSHLHVLLTLTAGEQHGYAIMRAVEARGGRLGPGALYAALGRLLDTGLVEELDERPTPELDDARRRYYRITLDGRASLVAELSRLQGVLDTARDHGVAWRTDTPAAGGAPA
jgi:DNA-binding PadR family transcriptional regulator